jgi:hypothetical protein
MLSAALFFTCSTVGWTLESESEIVYQGGKATKVLGTKMGADLETATVPGRGVTNAISLHSLGATLQALFALTSPPNTIDGTTYNEVYSFGKRVFSDSYYVQKDGAGLILGLAPTQVRVPAVTFPVGPLSVHVDGGARFQANLMLSNMTDISLPFKHSAPGLQIKAIAAAAGFVEGYAKFFFVRGGVGGQLDLVDAHLDVNTRFSLDGGKTLVQVSAIAEFLKGRLYAFIDVFGLGRFGWRRLLDQNLYNWNGYCIAAGNLQCPAST